VDLHKLECFLAVSKHGSFTKAAESLFVTQSGLSYTIGRLERELGVRLFSRRGRGVTLTTAGEAFLPGAQECLLAARAAKEAASEVGGLLTGQLSLAVSPTQKRLIADLVFDFHRAHPEVRTSIYVRYPEEALDLVRSASVPLAVVGIDDLSDQLTSCELYDEEIVVVFPPGTEPPDQVPVNDLGQIPLVASRWSQLPQREKRPRWLVSRDTKVVAEADDVDAVIELVLVGLGATVMSVGGARAAEERGAVVASLDPPIFYKVGIVHRTGRLTPVERAFRDVAVDKATSLRW